MGRIQPVRSSSDGEVAKIRGFDFAEWLKSTVIEKDFVGMKMDVEGTEFDLIPRLFETRAICLIDVSQLPLQQIAEMLSRGIYCTASVEAFVLDYSLYEVL
ncbi:hypothetical protein NL676_020824 [Syzygium grande]|nr:hypothetical protein NL676_020824 [Syzygium grande]